MMANQRTKETEKIEADMKRWRGELSQSEMAAQLQISVRTLQEIEQGRGYNHTHILYLAMKQLGRVRDGD